MRRVLIVMVAAGAAAALLVLGMRARLEARYRAVEIVLDGDDWVGLIRREGARVEDVLVALRQRGATSVALGDNTLKRLADEGVVSYASGGTLTALARLAPLDGPLARVQQAGTLRTDAVYVTGPPDGLDFVRERLQALLGLSRVRAPEGALEVLGTQIDLEEMGLGFRPVDAAAVRAAGLGVVLRPRNHRSLTPKSLRVLADSYARTAPEPTLIFALTEVQGYEELVPAAAEEYRRIGARFGRIEVFTARRKQKGEDQLTALMRPSVIRVFSITPEELVILRAEEAAARFVRAAQERNIRILYVRPLLSTPAGEPALETNLRLVETVTKDLRRLGLVPQRARPMPPLEVPAPLVMLVAVGAAALALVALTDLARAVGLPVPAALVWAILAAAALGTAAAGITRFDTVWRQLLALGTASAAAAGATAWALPSGPVRRPAVAGWLTLIRAVGLASLAGVFVAALLSQWPFMLAFSTFLGVKAAHVAPVALVALWLGFDRHGRGDWQDTVRDLGVWIGRPLRLGSALAVLVVGLAGVMLLARTGNISLPLLGAEQQLRTVLESVLVARPRTKEFLVGYPALVLAGAAAGLGWRPAAVALAALGTVGAAGVINSFSHLHTPLVYTVWRTANALVLGAALAVPGVMVLLWLARRPARS
jgi:hypothetical protein